MSAAKVLVVDDEEDVAAYLAVVLEDHGYEALRAGDGDAAWALLREHRPRLICLDLLMPGRTGLSVYRELRTRREFDAMPVLVVSGLSMEAELRGRLHGLPPPDGYLEKPVEPEVFIAAVRRLAGE